MAHTSQPCVEMISDARDLFANEDRAAAWQELEKLKQRPRGNELKQIAKCASLFGAHAVKLARLFERGQLIEPARLFVLSSFLPLVLRDMPRWGILSSACPS